MTSNLHPVFSDILTQFQVIQKGAEEAVRLDPRPLRQSSIVDAIDAAVSRMPAFPLFPPAPDQITGEYRDRPCIAPREREGGLYHTPICECGYRMGEHKALQS